METEAVQFATTKHNGQFRKFSGEPYVEHPMRVSKIVKQYTNKEEIIIAALLHDVIEDTNATYGEILSKFGATVANLVMELTNDNCEIAKIGKTSYLCKKINILSSDALLIKLADRLDNVSDLSMEREIWSKQYSKQTQLILTNLHKFNDDQASLILAINNKIMPYID